MPASTTNGVSKANGASRSKRARLPAGASSRAVPDLSIWMQAGRLGGLTPAQVSQIFRQADTGEMRSLMDLANESRQKNCHLQGVLSVSEESIAGLPWQLVLPEGARAKDKRACAWVEEVLRASATFPRLIAHLAGGIFYSYDVSEILWRKDAGRLAPAAFEHLQHRRFGFRPADGAFVKRDMTDPAEGVDFRKEWPNKFVVTQPRVTGDAAHREGLCRTLIWATLFRTWTFSDWLRTAEIAWKPWRIGSYKKGATSVEDRDGLETVLDRLSTTGWAVKPDSTTIDIEWPAGGASTKATHGELSSVLAQEMSKAVLGQTESTQASTSSGYGQAKVHDEVRRDLREARARQIAQDITRDVVRAMIELNFDGVIVPRFEFITQDPVDLVAFADGVGKLTSAGLSIPAKWARDQAGIPEPKDDEETIGGKPDEPVDEPTDPPSPDGAKPPADAPKAAA